MELNHAQEEKMTMLDNRRDFINQEPIHDLFYTVDVVKNKIIQIVDERVLLDQSIAKKLADSSGDLPQKKLTRDLATKKIGNKARSCASYFQDPAHQDLSIAKVLLKTKSYYDTKKDGDIATTFAGIRTILFDNQAVLTEYGINDAYFVAFDLLITNMNQWTGTPAQARQSQYAGDTQIDNYITDTLLLYDQLTNLVIDNFEDTNPNETAEFIATGKETTVGVHHNIVDASIKNRDLGINRAQLDIIDTVTGLTIKTLFMDPYGVAQFFCANKPFYAKASAPGFITQQILFKPIYRGTFHLDFIMIPI